MGKLPSIKNEIAEAYRIFDLIITEICPEAKQCYYDTKIEMYLRVWLETQIEQGYSKFKFGDESRP